MSVSATLASEYRYRGEPLSDERPTAALNLAYDDPSGLYAGGSLLAQDTQEGVESLGHIAYVGYARRLSQGPALDLGVINYRFTSYLGPKRTTDFTEVYVGVAGDRAAAHLYYTPDSYESGVRTLYADLEGSIPAGRTFRAFGHLGVLAPVGGRTAGAAGKTRYDVRAGFAAQVRDVEFSLAWTHLSRRQGYPSDEEDRDAIVASAAVYF